MSSFTDTIAALATPVGTSAIAVVRASGPDVAALIQTLFRETPPPRQVQRSDYCDASGQLVDDVLFTYFAAPNSFTGEDLVEISCHGNPFIVQQILEDLLARGCRAAEAGEFTKRAFLNGRMDLSQAEAVMDLIHAQSERALAAANQQLRGSLKRKMDNLISLLVNVLAYMEAFIDFPDEDLPEEDRRSMVERLRAVLAGTSQLLATSHYGDLLRDGIKTVIVGDPNAGKSSLLNQLVGKDRALVSPEPGTTRDYIEERIIVGVHCLRFIDTAGLNQTPSSLEKRGIDKTLEQVVSGDIFLWVLDSTKPIPALPPPLLSRLTSKNTIVVFNKIDLQSVALAPLPGEFCNAKVSALRGTGIEDLKVQITRLADTFLVETGDELIVINARHSHALEQARCCLNSALEKMTLDESIEFIVSDLRCAIEAFGQISGKVDSERVLDELFATFCIGK